MSHDYSAIKNKHPKVYFNQHLSHSEEQRDHTSSDLPIRFEARLSEKSSGTRRKFRSIAAKLINLPLAVRLKLTFKPSDGSIQESEQQLRRKIHDTELIRVDRLQIIALDAKVAALKAKYNAKRLKLGLRPITQQSSAPINTRG